MSTSFAVRAVEHVGVGLAKVKAGPAEPVKADNWVGRTGRIAHWQPRYGTMQPAARTLGTS
jgi:hypothetical protein